jgi:hypothetical protein
MFERFQLPVRLLRICGCSPLACVKMEQVIGAQAKSSIRRQYRFGSCRRKQQSTRDECGEALLDTELGEMVRSQ